MVVFSNFLHSIHTVVDSYTRWVTHGKQQQDPISVLGMRGCFKTAPLQQSLAVLNCVAQSAQHRDVQRLFPAAGIPNLI